MATAEEAGESLDAFVRYMNNRVAPNPSPRNPKTSRDHNYADIIEAQCQEDGHHTWGFVIYRSTYDSDADWKEVMRRMRFWPRETMDYFNGQDVLETMTWTVFEDRSLFDGVPTATIRKHFKEWSQSAVLAEQGTANPGKSSRYRYCLQIDSEAMHSILQEPTPPDLDENSRGWLKLIVKDWLPANENPIYATARRSGLELNSEVYDPIEGMTEQHIGFVRCAISGVMLNLYILFRDFGNYCVWERRPPEIVE